MSFKESKGWYSRGFLPHFDSPDTVQSLTIRLGDSMPTSKIVEWKQLLLNRDDAALAERVEKYLDAGHGGCVLKNPIAAEIVESALLHFDGERYRLVAWVVMPNHVHALVEMLEGHPLSSLIHSWKSFSTNQIQRKIGHKGDLWQREVFDRFVRSEAHLRHCINYIHNNPVAAGLVERPEQWRYSSAWRQLSWI